MKTNTEKWVTKPFNGEVEVIIDEPLNNAYGIRRIICTMEDYDENAQDAELICMAKNVATETGKTPRQLAEENKRCKERIDELGDQLNQGRDYLMGVNPSDLTVEDALEAFGFGRNGLRS